MRIHNMLLGAVVFGEAMMGSYKWTAPDGVEIENYKTVTFNEYWEKNIQTRCWPGTMCGAALMLYKPPKRLHVYRDSPFADRVLGRDY